VSGAGSFSVRRRFRAWWQARLPLTDQWTLTQRNIYILPTRAGLAFARDAAGDAAGQPSTTS
jgi:hypothetical protein